MNNIETMKLALEALELSHPRFGVGTAIHIKAVATLRQAIEQAQQAQPVVGVFDYKEHAEGLQRDYDLLLAEYNDLKAQQTEPVATNDTSQERVDETAKQRHEPCGLECDCTDVCKQENYKALWQQMCERCDELDKKLAQQAEPVAYIRVSKTGHVMACAKTGDFFSLPHKTLLYTSPPPRQPLTDWEINTIAQNNHPLDGIRTFARAIEAAHGIKEAAAT